MTTPREPTMPNDDAIQEPTEGHVDVDAATAWHRGEPNQPLGEDHEPRDPLKAARETLAGLGGSAAGKPAGFIAGAGLTDHDQPVEGGREQVEDGSAMDEPGMWRSQEDQGAP